MYLKTYQAVTAEIVDGIKEVTKDILPNISEKDRQNAYRIILSRIVKLQTKLKDRRLWHKSGIDLPEIIEDAENITSNIQIKQPVDKIVEQLNVHGAGVEQLIPEINTAPSFEKTYIRAELGIISQLVDKIAEIKRSGRRDLTRQDINALTRIVVTSELLAEYKKISLVRIKLALLRTTVVKELTAT